VSREAGEVHSHDYQSSFDFACRGLFSLVERRGVLTYSPSRSLSYFYVSVDVFSTRLCSALHMNPRHYTNRKTPRKMGGISWTLLSFVEQRRTWIRTCRDVLGTAICGLQSTFTGGRRKNNHYVAYHGMYVTESNVENRACIHPACDTQRDLDVPLPLRVSCVTRTRSSKTSRLSKSGHGRFSHEMKRWLCDRHHCQRSRFA
jgi:hypothetical protein